MDVQRRDAARNRARILDAAQGFIDRGEPLTLNAVARAADTGVGTVYRHFQDVEVLEEVLVWSRFDDLSAMLAGATPQTVEVLLENYLRLLVSDPLFEKVAGRAETAHEDTSRLRDGLLHQLAALMHEAVHENQLRRDVTADDLLALLCGLAHSLRSLGVSAGSDRAHRLFEILMQGLRP